MKSAELICKTEGAFGIASEADNNCTILTVDEIKQIQLDAWKQGVEDLYKEVTQNNTSIELAQKMLRNKHD